MMRITVRLFALVLAPLIAAGMPLAGGHMSSADVVVDHVFLVVPPDAKREIARLTELGITFDPRVSRHTGGGTASRAAFFANAYLELLWVDSSVSVAPDQQATVRQFRRATTWRSSGVSPIGIGLRRTPSAPDSLSLPGRVVTGEWMQPGTALFVLGATDDSVGASVFVVPRSSGVDAWVDIARRRVPELFRHSLGMGRLTAVAIHCPLRACPSAAAALRDVSGLRFVPGSEHLLELTFDEGRNDRLLDLRPDLPLVIRL